jgi:ribose 5-phosphate isomerase B
LEIGNWVLEIMIIFLASDHAGFELKAKIKKYLEEGGYEVQDLGPFEFDKDDDYPDFIRPAAEAVAACENKNDIPRLSEAHGGATLTCTGIIMGGGGQGEAMVANRVPGVRAAVFYGPRVPVGAADISGRVSEDPYEQIRLAREHNNANILSFGARFVTDNEAFQAIKIFLNTPFSGDERHIRRLKKF